jgi:hypothetical protein
MIAGCREVLNVKTLIEMLREAVDKLLAAVIIQLRVVILGVDSFLNISESLRGHIGALAFKNRLKKVFNLI